MIFFVRIGCEHAAAAQQTADDQKSGAPQKPHFLSDVLMTRLFDNDMRQLPPNQLLLRDTPVPLDAKC